MTRSVHQEKVIRDLTAGWVAAIGAQDGEAALAFYGPDIRSFDVILDQQVRGADDYRDHLARCMLLCNGEPVFEMYDLEVSVEGDLAVCHGMIHCGCEDENGEMKTGWMRGTLVWRCEEGRWQICHEHLSNPFDPGSGELIMEWRPQHQPQPLPRMEKAS